MTRRNRTAPDPVVEDRSGYEANVLPNQYRARVRWDKAADERAIRAVKAKAMTHLARQVKAAGFRAGDGVLTVRDWVSEPHRYYEYKWTCVVSAEEVNRAAAARAEAGVDPLRRVQANVAH